MAAQNTSILVVDDDLHYPRLLQEIARTAKLPTPLTWLESGEKALDYLEETAKAGNVLHHLILLDINMPGMDGFDFLSRLRKNTALRFIPVLMLSISTSSGDIQRSYELGANAYITKPTDFNDLQDMLQAIHQFWFRHAIIAS